MSIKRIIIFSFTLMCLLSCGSSENILGEMEIEAELLIPAGLNTFDTHYFYVRNVPTRISNVIVNSLESVDRIQASNAQLVGRVQEIDYGIIDEIIINVFSPSDPSTLKEVFYNNRIPFSQDDDLQLLSSLSNVNEILSEEFVDLEIRIVFRSFTPRELDTRLLMQFNLYSDE